MYYINMNDETRINSCETVTQVSATNNVSNKQIGFENATV